jgi:hypothetical protein
MGSPAGRITHARTYVQAGRKAVRPECMRPCVTSLAKSQRVTRANLHERDDRGRKECSSLGFASACVCLRDNKRDVYSYRCRASAACRQPPLCYCYTPAAYERGLRGGEDSAACSRNAGHCMLPLAFFHSASASGWVSGVQ